MKITAITAWQVDLPLVEGRYSWSRGNYVEVFDSTVVAVETDAGITGYAECCPLGSAYLPAYAAGVRAGLKELGPKLIGHDPTDLDGLNRTMDAALRGHPYVKSPIDIACWDILGKSDGPAGLHAARRAGTGTDCALSRHLAGIGRRRWRKRSPATAPKATPSSSSRSAATPMRTLPASVPCRAMLRPGDILVADANTGWTRADAAARRQRGRANSTSISSSPARATRNAWPCAAAPTVPSCSTR